MAAPACPPPSRPLPAVHRLNAGAGVPRVQGPPILAAPSGTGPTQVCNQPGRARPNEPQKPLPLTVGVMACSAKELGEDRRQVLVEQELKRWFAAGARVP